jgi:hypothetical protein
VYQFNQADLLDILSNGSIPKKVLVHTPKVRYSANKHTGPGHIPLQA